MIYQNTALLLTKAEDYRENLLILRKCGIDMGILWDKYQKTKKNLAPAISSIKSGVKDIRTIAYDVSKDNKLAEKGRNLRDDLSGKINSDG
jgi:hypothetical protein